MSKSDRRVKYTKQALQNAVLELLKKKSIDSMTVKEICEIADVNRGTFYLHYSHPRDILTEIETQFMEENQISFNNYWEQEHDLGSMVETFSWITSNLEWCKILLGNHGDPSFVERMKQMEKERILDEWQKEYPSYTRGTLEFVFEFVFHGTMKLVLNWINDEQGICVEEFTKRLDALGHHVLLAAGEFDSSNELD